MEECRYADTPYSSSIVWDTSRNIRGEYFISILGPLGYLGTTQASMSRLDFYLYQPLIALMARDPQAQKMVLGSWVPGPPDRLRVGQRCLLAVWLLLAPTSISSRDP